MLLKRYLLQAGALMGLIGCLASCQKEEDVSKPILGLEGDQWARTELDTWLYDNFTKPYNIDVQYRWDNSQQNYSYTLVPPSIDKVKPMMEVVKAAWIDVYTEEAGADFMKLHAPRQYTLVGSYRYNATSITLGEAEGGNKVVLLGVDDFVPSDRAKLKRVLKTIHHEFTHILNQKVVFPVEYRQVTRGQYTANWNQIATATARDTGFISSYAMAAEGEDFAEMASIMITEGKIGFDAIVNAIASPTSRAKIRTKEAMVVSYFKSVWNIDIYSLQNRVQEKIEDFAPTPPLHNTLGFGKTYTSLTTGGTHLAGLTGEFQTAYTEAKTNLQTNGSGRVLDSVYLQFTAANKATLRVKYFNAAGSAFYAYFGYDAAVSSQGVATLTYTGPLTTPNANANTVGPYLTALTGYFNGAFQISWPNGRPAVVLPYYGSLYKVNATNSHFTGLLGN